MPSRSTLRPLLALIAVLALPGCGGDSDVLARVGGQTISKQDFLAAARMLANRYPGSPDSAKAQLLRDLVEREVLVQGAAREGVHQDTLLLDYRRHVEEQILRQRFYDELGAANVPVSDAETQELYRWRGQESWVELVVALSEPMARAALNELQRGAEWAQVADRFNPPGYTPPGGDLGYIKPGMLQLPLDDVVRTAPIGTIRGPIETTGQGWFLVRVKERRKAEQGPYELERGLLTTILRQRKQREVLVRALDQLREGYHVTLRKGAAQELMGRLIPYAIQGTEPPPLTPVESAGLLVEYDGGAYTLGDAIADMRAGQVQRPNINMMPAVERWLEVRGLERASLIEALRRQLDQQPDVRRAVRERVNDYLLEGYISRLVLQPATITEDDVRAAFARAGMMPQRLDEARFLAVVLRDSATAAQIAATAPQAEGLREAVATAALGVPVRTENVKFPTAHPLWGPLEHVFMAIAPGAYTPAIPVPGGWLVAQLVTRNVVPQTFETLPPEMRPQLESDALEKKRSDRLRALSDSLRHVIPVAVYPARLKNLPWPATTMPFQVQG